MCIIEYSCIYIEQIEPDSVTISVWKSPSRTICNIFTLKNRNFESKMKWKDARFQWYVVLEMYNVIWQVNIILQVHSNLCANLNGLRKTLKSHLSDSSVLQQDCFLVNLGFDLYLNVIYSSPFDLWYFLLNFYIFGGFEALNHNCGCKIDCNCGCKIAICGWILGCPLAMPNLAWAWKQ